MPGPLLIVELPTADTTAPEAAALVRACSEGLGRGRCELSSQSAAPAAAVAVVSLRGPDAIGALIEVGSRRRESRSWRTQELTFQPQDARLERFRTLGFAIATLFREAQVEPAREKSATDEPRKAPRVRPAGKEASAAESKADAEETSRNGPSRSGTLRVARYPSGWLTAGAFSAFDDDLPVGWRFGGQLALGVAPFELPLFISLSGSYAVEDVPATNAQTEISLSWATLALGAGGYLSLPSDFSLRIGAQGVLVDLSAHASEDGRRQEAQRWLIGGQAGVELVAFTSRRWGLAVGGALQQLKGGTAVTLHNRDAADVGAFTWLFHASFELRPFQR